MCSDFFVQVSQVIKIILDIFLYLVLFGVNLESSLMNSELCFKAYSFQFPKWYLERLFCDTALPAR